MKKNIGILKVSGKLFNDILNNDISFELFMYAFYKAKMLIIDYHTDFCSNTKFIKAISPNFKEVEAGGFAPEYVLTFNEIIIENTEEKIVRRILFSLHEIENNGTLSVVYQDTEGFLHETIKQIKAENTNE